MLSSLSVKKKTARELRTEGKGQGYLLTQKTLFEGSRVFYDVGRFPGPVEVVAFPRQGVEIYLSHFQGSYPVNVFGDIC